MTTCAAPNRPFEKTGNRVERKTWLGLLGNVHLARAEYKEAAELLQARHRHLSHPGRSWALRIRPARYPISRASSFRTGDFDAAERYTQRSPRHQAPPQRQAAEVYSDLNAAKSPPPAKQYPEAEAMVVKFLALLETTPRRACVRVSN